MLYTRNNLKSANGRSVGQSTGSQVGRQSGRQAGSQAGWLAGRLAGWLAGRQTSRLTGRRTRKRGLYQICQLTIFTIFTIFTSYWSNVKTLPQNHSDTSAGRIGRIKEDRISWWSMYTDVTVPDKWEVLRGTNQWSKPKWFTNKRWNVYIKCGRVDMSVYQGS